jgi:hypothetical protein
MRASVLVVLLTACAHAPHRGEAAPRAPLAFAVTRPPSVAPPAGLLPAGACGFDPYLGDACEDAASFAVVTLRTNDVHAAERALRRGPRFAGYPFVESFDRIPAADARIRGMGVFAGLFGARRDADAFARATGAEVIPLATVEELEKRAGADLGDFDEHEAHVLRVVETTTTSPAYDEADLERVEGDLDERLAGEWTKLPGQQARRAAALATLPPRCTVGSGRVFATNEGALYTFRRQYAPVTCDDGHAAWVPWRATRLESTVVRTRDAFRIHQVILVECDVPTLETRALGPAPQALGALTDANCGDP